MKNLIDFLVHYKHWFVFVILEVISLVSLFNYNGYQKSVYFTTANGFVGSIYNTISSVSSYLNLKVVNQQMEKDNEALRMQVRALQQKLIDMGVDSLQVRGLSAQYHMVNAQVINSTLHRGANLMTINKGEVDGIRPEMGVVCSNGVVGIVSMTSKHYSIVIPIINIHTKISCRVRGSEYFGSLMWKHGNPEVAYATGFPRHAKLKIGQVIETNGYSDIFPPDIPIGYMFKIMNSEDGVSYMLKVQLYTDFKNLREVSVITNYKAPERVLLEQAADTLTVEDYVEEVKRQEELKKLEESKKADEAAKKAALEAQKLEEEKKAKAAQKAKELKAKAQSAPTTTTPANANKDSITVDDKRKTKN